MPVPAPIAAPMIDISEVQDIITEEVSTPTIPVADTTSFIEVQEEVPQQVDTLGLNFTTENTTTSPLFGMISEATTSSNEATIEPSIDEFMSESTETNTALTEDFVTENTKKEIAFRNTAEYLMHAAEEMKVLETILVNANKEKIEERDDYRDKKKHFAELEKTAEGEHKKMIEELEHVADMQEYFKKELIKDTTAANDATYKIAA